ncbi:creatininase family protein [Streptomyces sp. NPDC049687]|uniref:creatininase family protein n=1 Tax=Streptomyces sp. NPDC049687 TaxID=3365596 RepID=UPI0037B9B5E7
MATELARSTWPAVPTGDVLVLVPVGSTEQHGPHLPLATDRAHVWTRSGSSEKARSAAQHHPRRHGHPVLGFVHEFGQARELRPGAVRTRAGARARCSRVRAGVQELAHRPVDEGRHGVRGGRARAGLRRRVPRRAGGLASARSSGPIALTG